MQVAYAQNRLFADGSIERRIKINKFKAKLTERQKEQRKKERQIKERKKQKRRTDIISDLCKLTIDKPTYLIEKRKLEHELRLIDELINFDNVRRSANRSRQNLYDICRCNEFDFFVTLTFDGEKIDRLDDEKVKRKFTQWANYIHRRYPEIYYVATPEYHGKGGLHFHLLVGGVSFEDLKCVPAINKHGNLVYKNGKQIFNIGSWKVGFSTLSKIENSEASKYYLCKYISKQNLDTRFFKKRRYATSHNINRPEITKECLDVENCLNDIDLDMWLIKYADPLMKYVILSYDGNGIINPKLNDLASKDIVKTLARKEIAEPKRRMRLGSAIASPTS